MRTILISAFLACLAACSSPVLPQNQNAPTRMQTRNTASIQAVTGISPQEAFDWLADPNASWLLLDVRTPEEYGQGHLNNARLMNFYDPAFRTKLLNMNRHQPTIIYCRSGNRSGQALEMMRELGFKNVYDIQGGIVAWQAAGFPLEK